MRDKRLAKTTMVIFLALVLAVIPILAACARGEAVKPPVEHEIKIGFLYDLTAGVASQSMPIHLAAIDYLKYVNTEKGGVEGYPVKHLWRDTRSDVAITIGGYKAFKEQGVVNFVVGGSPALPALASYFEQDQIACLAMAQNPTLMFPPRWYYQLSPNPPEMVASWVDWAIKEGTWADPAKKKVAIMYVAGSYGNAIFQGGTQYLQAVGVEVVAKEEVAYIPLSVKAELERIRARKPDYLLLIGTFPVGVTTLREMNEIGYKLPVVGFSGLAPTDILQSLKPELVEGYSFLSCYAETPDLEGTFVRELWNKNHPPAEWNTISAFMYGLTVNCVSLTLDCVKKAITAVGIENLNGAAVKKYGWDTVKGFKPIVGDFTFNIQPGVDNRASDWMRIQQVKGGKIIDVTPWKHTPTVWSQGVVSDPSGRVKPGNWTDILK